MNEWLRFAIVVLATWRVTHLIAYEDGPWDAIARVRKVAGSGFFGKLMDCFYCLSLWVSAVPAATIARNLREGLLLWLGMSGAACLLDRIGREPVIVQGISENAGGQDVLLRTDQADSNRHDTGEGSHGRSDTAG